MKKISLCLVLYCLAIYPGYSSNRYFLCGPDEDGCMPDIYQYCFCIPYNDMAAYKPHCLNFTDLTCVPFAPGSHCEQNLMFKNQGECLAVLFHSGYSSPCKLATGKFCADNHIPLCAVSGQPASCH